MKKQYIVPNIKTALVVRSSFMTYSGGDFGSEPGNRAKDYVPTIMSDDENVTE